MEKPISLRNISLKKAYSSDFDDILHDFYIPALEASVQYDRIAGFFSSSSLAIASRGISGLIKNGGVMKLIVSPKLSKKDLEIILSSQKEPEKYIEEKMMEELDKLENKFVRDHVLALGWMIANKKLEIKVAVVYNNEGKLSVYEDIQKEGIFHQKIGILKDSEGNTLTFSGSVNETAYAWLKNIEEFKVFRGWESSEEEYIKPDISKFNRFWNNQSERVKIIDIPSAVKNKFIRIAPDNIEEINLEDCYKKSKRKKRIELRDYQKEAIQNWLDNNKRGIFEMATGTGKTFTALGCLKRVIADDEKLLTVIACPYDHLVKQWKDCFEKFDLEANLIIADSSNYKWKKELANSIYDIKNGITDRIVVITTHDSFYRPDFIKIIKGCNSKKFLLVDEVHGAGSKERMAGLLEVYDFRLGLSATPKRYFDEDGTDIILGYFNESVSKKSTFEFPLSDAIDKGYLAPYEYKPYFIELTEEELQEYIEKSKNIARLYYSSKDNQEKKENLKLLCIIRQKIVVNAVNKFNALIQIIDDLEPINNCLIYCSEKQIKRVLNILSEKNIKKHKFTMGESTTPKKEYNGLSEREFILDNFSKGNYQALVAIRILDEGVDIPSAKYAIILASSGNPKEHIQRIGRVLRQNKDKERAVIYDVIVLPPLNKLSGNEFEIERKIIKKEIKRYKDIAESALNSLDCFQKIYDVEEKYNISDDNNY